MAEKALLIGTFDGVHLGHHSLIEAARQHVGAAGHIEVLTFDPPPSEVLGRGPGHGRLTRASQRESLMLQSGVDEVTTLKVDEDFLGQSAGEFLSEHVDPRSPTVMVEGPDFRFGHARTGDVHLLKSHGRTQGFEVEIVPPLAAHLKDGSEVACRSRVIRSLLRSGRMADAWRLLGRPWLIEGPVVKGDQRGRTLECPTANLDHGPLVLPGDGVYLAQARCPDGVFPAAVSVGRKPTFESTEPVLEAHLIGWNGRLDDYGWWLEVELHAWHRDQVAYSTIADLRAALTDDIAAAQAAASC